MTSYPAGNKTSQYWKPCIPHKKLLWNSMRKSWLLFQNTSWKLPEAPPDGEITMTIYWPREDLVGLSNYKWIIQSYQRWFGKVSPPIFEPATNRSSRWYAIHSDTQPPRLNSAMRSKSLIQLLKSLWLLNELPRNGVSWTYIYIPVNRLWYWVKRTKFICCFMRVAHAINNIYKLISFFN